MIDAGTNIFTETSARAELFGAVNLGQGFPDVSGPAQVVEAAVRALRDGRNQYPPVPGFAPRRPAGTFFVTADIGGLSDEDGRTFCHRLPERCGVAAIPNQVFYASADPGAGLRQVRFTFAKPDHVLSEALHRLRQGLVAG